MEVEMTSANQRNEVHYTLWKANGAHRQIQNKYINMIILHRDISPAASFQTDITQHLPGSKRNVPDVIPGQGK